MHFRTHVSAEKRAEMAKMYPNADEYQAGMIEHDMHIGQFLDLLDELGIADNTIVHYSTDNGPHYNTWPDSAATPFRGEKNTNWEGGWRVPAVVRWPGTIEPGSVSNGVVHHMDWLPTFLAAAGKSDIKEDLLDGSRPRLQGPPRWLRPDRTSQGSAEGREPPQGDLLLLRRWRPDRPEITSNTYYDWMLDRVFLLLPASDYVGKFLGTFKEFPPRQKAASFNLEQVMKMMTDPGGAQ